MSNKTSQHILTSSANLLGFCLLVLTSLHITSYAEKSLIDELTCVIALLLTMSSIFSILSMQSKDNAGRLDRLEAIAEFLFTISLLGIFGIIIFILIKFWGFQ